MFFKRYFVFTLLHADETYKIKTFAGEYDDLRELINKQIQPPNFGLCDGMGRCATCMVTIQAINPLSKPELNLSCQLPINDELTNKVFSILPYTP